jgi:hypothetical protein
MTNIMSNIIDLDSRVAEINQTILEAVQTIEQANKELYHLDSMLGTKLASETVDDLLFDAINAALTARIHINNNSAVVYVRK